MWACPAAGLIERYEDRCQKSACVYVLLWVCRGGDCAATESQSICEVLYLLLYTFKKRVVNHKQNITKKLKISSPLSLKISTYLSPFLKVQLVPVPVSFCFVFLFQQPFYFGIILTNTKVAKSTKNPCISFTKFPLILIS